MASQFVRGGENVAQTYRSYRGRGGTTYRSRAEKAQRLRRVELRLTFCLALAAAFSVARLLFPAFFGGIRDDISQRIGMNADFKSAAFAVGEAIRGEKRPAEAFSEAFACVFEGDREETLTEAFAEGSGESTEI